MALTSAEEARIQLIESNLSDVTITVNNIVTNTKEPSALTDTEKQNIFENIGNLAIDVNDSAVKVGYKVYGQKAGIFEGEFFFGEVLVAPPTQDSHIKPLIIDSGLDI